MMNSKSAQQGSFRFLYEMPFVEVGLLQAYLLMSFLGVTLVIGSFSEKFVKFDIVGLIAHLIPLLALFAFRNQVHQFMGSSTFLASFLIHTSFISLEALAIALYFKGQRAYGVG